MLKQTKLILARANQTESTIDGRIYCSLKQLMDLRWQVKALTLPKTSKISRVQSGAHRSKFRGRGMEFSEVRVYQPGDDVRTIDWRVTARRQTPHTKLFEEEKERPLFILCDQSPSQFFGSRHSFKSVRAAETAALFAWSGLQHNDKVGGIVYSNHGHHEIKPARNRQHTLRFLQLISEFNQALSITMPTPKKHFLFEDALLETIRLTKPGTLIVIVSDFCDLTPSSEKYLSKLRQHSELLLIHTSDPLEYTLPDSGIYPISNGQETVVVNASYQALHKKYGTATHEKQEALVRLSHHLRAPLIEVSTEVPALNAIQRTLYSLQH